jgi:hypothetical protein
VVYISEAHMLRDYFCKSGTWQISAATTPHTCLESAS